MQTNFLEEVVAEWLEYQGYLVKRNERVGPNPNGNGGHEGELDVVAFNPKTGDLLHVEPSTDSWSWHIREEKFRRKFASGGKYVKSLFDGLTLPGEIHQRAVFAYGSDRNHKTIGGGEVQMAEDLLVEILGHLKRMQFSSRAVPERYPILRVLHMIARHRKRIVAVLNEP